MPITEFSAPLQLTLDTTLFFALAAGIAACAWVLINTANRLESENARLRLELTFREGRVFSLTPDEFAEEKLKRELDDLHRQRLEAFCEAYSGVSAEDRARIVERNVRDGRDPYHVPVV
jgi:hypothetical protein